MTSEAQLRMPLHVQLHMNAIQQLLKICQADCVHLTDGIKRAIFWSENSQPFEELMLTLLVNRQDLNSSTMTGSNRIVDHTTFAELEWRRDPFTPKALALPPGFQRRSQLLTEEFVEVLEDIHALQCIRDNTHFESGDVLSMAQIDNHQASIQSRLAAFTNLSPLLDCCRLAAYLCSTTLRCKLWPASIVPVSDPHALPANSSTPSSRSIACRCQRFTDFEFHRRISHCSCSANYNKQKQILYGTLTMIS